MLTDLPTLEDLPRQNASQVKNKWRDVVRLVRQSGSVAITNHAAVEMVLVDAATYRQLAGEILALKAREKSVLDDLTARFNERLSVLQEPAAARNVTAVFEAKGKLALRPKAGATF
jgi:prevent-host-death family protein